MKIHRNHSFAFAAILAAGLAVCPTLSRAQDLVDGSFENPVEAPNSITEVTSTGIAGVWTGSSIGGNADEYIINGNVQDLQGRNYGNPEFGSQYLGLNAIRNNSFHSIESQIVTGFTAGRTYSLTLYIANLDGATDPKVEVSASEDSGTGTILADNTFTVPVEGPYGTGTIDFVKEMLTFTALGSTVSFSINNQSKTGVMGIDNVSVAAAVPEPATIAATLLGLGIVVGVLVRRRVGSERTA